MSTSNKNNSKIQQTMPHTALNKGHYKILVITELKGIVQNIHINCTELQTDNEAAHISTPEQRLNSNIIWLLYPVKIR